MLKTGSKAYYEFWKKIHYFGLSFAILGAIGKYYLWINSINQNDYINVISNTLLIAGIGLYILVKIVSLFEPLREPYNWELVYPELALHQEDGEKN